MLRWGIVNALVHRFVRFASGPLLWVNLAIVIAAKLIVPLAGMGLATIGTQLTAINAAQVISLTNHERTALGLGVLAEDARLDAAAQLKLADMARRGYFAHVTPDNRQPWDFILQAGYRYRSAGENLAKGFQDSTVLVRAWMGSPSHRANIVNVSYRNIGVAVGRATINGRESTVVVQMFAAPLAGGIAPKTAAVPLPTPRVQPVSTDTRIAGAELTEVVQPAAASGRQASGVATGFAGIYLSAIFVLLAAAFIVTGPRKHMFLALGGHGFALLLLTVIPALGLPVAHIF
jgi:hypothetical protein